METTAPEYDVVARLREPEVLSDPYPFLAWVRENVPVHRHPAGFYLVTRHADAEWVFRTPLMRGPEQAELAARYPTALKYRSIRLLLGTVAMSNPPAHTRIRRLVSRDFTAKRVENMRPGIEEATERLLADIEKPLRDGEVVDLHSRLSIPVSRSTIASLLGVPPADGDELGPLVVRVLQAMNPASTEAEFADADAASLQVEEYFEQLMIERRRHPREDLVSALLSKHDDDPDVLGEDELMSMVWGLWAGGFESSAAAADNAVLALLNHPDQAHWLRGGPDQVKAFVLETMRYDSASLLTGVVRMATEDVKIGDVSIPEGADVRPMPAAANRDPGVFEDPDRFEPSRDVSKALAFGHGIHYCLGAYLGRMEVSVMLERLHARFPDLVLAEAPRHRAAPPLRTCERLPVALAGSAT